MAPATHQSAGQASRRREHAFIGGEVLQEAASRAEVAALAGPVYAWGKGEAAAVGYLAAFEPACAGAFHHHVLCVVLCEVGVVVQLPLQTALARGGHQVLGTPATADTVQQQRGHQSQPSHGRGQLGPREASFWWRDNHAARVPRLRLSYYSCCTPAGVLMDPPVAG